MSNCLVHSTNGCLQRRNVGSAHANLGSADRPFEISDGEGDADPFVSFASSSRHGPLSPSVSIAQERRERRARTSRVTPSYSRPYQYSPRELSIPPPPQAAHLHPIPQIPRQRHPVATSSNANAPTHRRGPRYADDIIDLTAEEPPQATRRVVPDLEIDEARSTLPPPPPPPTNPPQATFGDIGNIFPAFPQFPVSITGILRFAATPFISPVADPLPAGNNLGPSISMDYTAAAFDLFTPGTPPPSTPPSFSPPSPAPQGFSRNPKEDETYVCPNCDDELFAGETDLEKQIWMIKSCGHVSLVSLTQV